LWLALCCLSQLWLVGHLFLDFVAWQPVVGFLGQLRVASFFKQVWFIALFDLFLLVLGLWLSLALQTLNWTLFTWGMLVLILFWLIIGIFLSNNCSVDLFRTGLIIQIANGTVFKFPSLDTGLNTHHQVITSLLLKLKLLCRFSLHLNNLDIQFLDFLIEGVNLKIFFLMSDFEQLNFLLKWLDCLLVIGDVEWKRLGCCSFSGQGVSELLELLVEAGNLLLVGLELVMFLLGLGSDSLELALLLFVLFQFSLKLLVPGFELFLFGFEAVFSFLEMVEPFFEFVVLCLKLRFFGFELSVSVIKVCFLLLNESLELSHFLLEL
jgi:hypothetical protein